MWQAEACDSDRWHVWHAVTMWAVMVGIILETFFSPKTLQAHKSFTVVSASRSLQTSTVSSTNDQIMCRCEGWCINKDNHSDIYSFPYQLFSHQCLTPLFPLHTCSYLLIPHFVVFLSWICPDTGKCFRVFFSSLHCKQVLLTKRQTLIDLKTSCQ